MTERAPQVQEEITQDCPQKAVRLLLLKRQQLLLHILLWAIEASRAQQAWSLVAGNACACGHGDAVCANTNTDHMLSFGQLAMNTLVDRLQNLGSYGEWQDQDAASSCLAESCIMAAQAINTAVQAIYKADAEGSSDLEPSSRYKLSQKCSSGQ